MTCYIYPLSTCDTNLYRSPNALCACLFVRSSDVIPKIPIYFGTDNIETVEDTATRGKRGKQQKESCFVEFVSLLRSIRKLIHRLALTYFPTFSPIQAFR